MKKLLIVERSEIRAQALDLALRNEWDVHTVMDSSTICNVLKEFQPDALILNYDALIEVGPQPFEDCFSNIPPVTLMLTRYISPYIIHTASRFGAGYIMTIPSRIDCIKDRINEMYDFYITPPETADKHLHVLGVNTALAGYRCLNSAIDKYSKDPTLMLKEIYPDTAKECGLRDARCVEHAVRTAISNAWRKRNVSIWVQYFSANEDNDIDLPTNKEFISAIAHRI